MSVATEIERGRAASKKDEGLAQGMLLVAAEPAASEVARYLGHQLRAEIEVAAEWAQCRRALQEHSYSLVVLEESMALIAPDGLDALYGAQSVAWVLEVNFGVCSPERLLRQVRAALASKAHNEERSRGAASTALRNQVKSCLTGLMLQTQLALRQSDAAGKLALHRILHLAEQLSELVQHTEDGGADTFDSKLHHRESGLTTKI